MANNVDVKAFTLNTARTMKTREVTGVNTAIHQIEDSAAGEILGVTTGAAVVTDATGSLQQYLRGLVKLWTAITIKAASTAPTATDPALVVAISPNSVNANGSNTSANSAPVVVASDQAPVAVKGNTVVQAASSTITRPANSTVYASGQLLANSTTAGSVNNLQFTTLARVSGGSGVIVGAQIQKSTNTNVSGAQFRLHLFNTAPTYVTAGDGSPIAAVVVASGKGYLGYIDITAMTAFSDVAWGSGAPDNTRGSIPYVATAQTIFGLIETRGAYSPASAEVFTVTLDALQD